MLTSVIPIYAKASFILLIAVYQTTATLQVFEASQNHALGLEETVTH